MTYPGTLSSARSSGFTIVELLVVLLVMAIVVTIAAPSMKEAASRTGTRGAVDRVTADIALARVYAIREGRPASLRIQSSTRYTVTVDTSAASPKVIKTVDLSGDHRGVQLYPSSGTLTFDSRGLLRTQGFSSVRATRGATSDSVKISSVGRTYRDY